MAPFTLLNLGVVAGLAVGTLLLLRRCERERRSDPQGLSRFQNRVGLIAGPVAVLLGVGALLYVLAMHIPGEIRWARREGSDLWLTMGLYILYFPGNWVTLFLAVLGVIVTVRSYRRTTRQSQSPRESLKWLFAGIATACGVAGLLLVFPSIHNVFAMAL